MLGRKRWAASREGVSALKRLTVLLAALLPVSGAQARDSLTIGIAEFPSSLHPSIDPLLIKTYVIGFATRTVTTYDAENRLVCLLCTEVPTLENGLARMEGGGMAVTLKLRPELRWGDGEPVTARDVAFTWRVGRDPNAGFSNANAWTRAVSVDVVDEHTAVLHLDRVLVSYAQWDQLLPEHVEGPVYERAKAAGDYINTTEYNRNPLNPGLWNGPYLVSGYQSGATITLATNPHWAGQTPGFKQVQMRLVADTAALQANLMAGDIDIDNNLTLDQVLALQKQYPNRFAYSYAPSLTYAHIDASGKNPVLADVRVRRALLMAVNRQTINERLYGGKTTLATNFVSPQNPEFDPTVPLVPYDPAAARRLLDEAGWTLGPNGIRRDTAGQRLSLEFLAASGFRVNELLQAVLQDAWKAVGVEVTLRTEPSRTLFGQTTKRRAFPGLVMYTWTSAVGESPNLTLGSAMVPSEVNNWSGANFTGFSDAAFDAAIATAESELDPARRRAAWATMQHIYAERLPALPLFITVIPQALPTWLRGFGPNGTGQPFTQRAEQWQSEP
jgi:peptide/nickel transport system substrate-binding protein